MKKLVTHEFLAFSDFHAHNFKYAAKKVQVDGWQGVYNSRLVDSLRVLDDIRTYAGEKGITHVLFGGDLFHRRSVVHVDVFNLVADRLARFTADGLELHMLVGNHDMADRQGYTHSLAQLAYLSDKVFVHEGVGALALTSGLSLYTVPYTDDVAQARDWLQMAGVEADQQPGETKKVLLAHLGMQGARVGSDYVLVSDGDIGVDDVPYDKFDLCLFGHFHEHQRLFRNGWFIGATHEHNWGDSGGARGFLHVKLYDDGSVSLDRIETSAPRFVHIRDVSDSCNPQDFVRAHVSQASESVQRRLSAQLSNQNVELIEEPEEVEELSLRLDKLDLAATIEAWTRAHNRPDEDELIQMGKNILANAVGNSL